MVTGKGDFAFRSDDMKGEERARRPVSCDLEPRYTAILMQNLYEQTIWRFPVDMTGRVEEFDIGKHDRTPCSKLTDRAENELREIDVVTARDRGHSYSIGRVHEIGKVRRGSWAKGGVRYINRRGQWPPNSRFRAHTIKQLVRYYSKFKRRIPQGGRAQEQFGTLAPWLRERKSLLNIDRLTCLAVGQKQGAARLRCAPHAKCLVGFGVTPPRRENICFARLGSEQRAFERGFAG
jgi:hypothetical protein